MKALTAEKSLILLLFFGVAVADSNRGPAD